MQIDKIVLASTALILKDSKILLLKRSEKESSYVGYWQPPEGHIEKDENPEITIVREVKEETGLEFTDPKYLGTSSYIYNLDKGNILGVRIVFTGIIDGDIKLSEDHSDYKWFTKEELENSKDIVPGTVKELLQFIK